MQRGLDLRDHARRDALEIADVVDVVEHLTQDLLHVVVLAKEPAVQAVQPFAPLRACDEREGAGGEVDPSACAKHVGNRLVAVQQHVHRQQKGKRRISHVSTRRASAYCTPCRMITRMSNSRCRRIAYANAVGKNNRLNVPSAVARDAKIDSVAFALERNQ